ncbi:MAG: hypothetical protein IPJ82_15890 [Lewinellaceae bacterium]|nr:hypothetical protein [Lewinellaceae bacterium]
MKTLCKLLLFVFFISSCKKEQKTPQQQYPYWGEVTLVKNGNTWKGQPFAATNKKLVDRLDIIIDSLDIYGNSWEALSFYKVPRLPGMYRVFNTTSQKQDSLVGSAFYYLEADILYGVYDILEVDSSSFITLISYDTVTKEIKGTFDVTFIAGIKPYPSAPDTLRLRNGTFHTKVIK